MNIKDIQIGKTYTYHPPKKHTDDNLHYPVLVLSLTPKGKVRTESMVGKRTISPHRLDDQQDWING